MQSEAPLKANVKPSGKLLPVTVNIVGISLYAEAGVTDVTGETIGLVSVTETVPDLSIDAPLLTV